MSNTCSMGSLCRASTIFVQKASGPHITREHGRALTFLEEEKIVVETKMARTDMNEREAALNIRRERAVPECQSVKQRDSG